MSLFPAQVNLLLSTPSSIPNRTLLIGPAAEAAEPRPRSSRRTGGGFFTAGVCLRHHAGPSLRGLHRLPLAPSVPLPLTKESARQVFGLHRRGDYASSPTVYPVEAIRREPLSPNPSLGGVQERKPLKGLFPRSSQGNPLYRHPSVIPACRIAALLVLDEKTAQRLIGVASVCQKTPSLASAGYGYRPTRGCRSLNAPRSGKSAYVRQPVFCIQSRIPRPSAPAVRRFPFPYQADRESADFLRVPSGGASSSCLAAQQKADTVECSGRPRRGRRRGQSPWRQLPEPGRGRGARGC